MIIVSQNHTLFANLIIYKKIINESAVYFEEYIFMMKNFVRFSLQMITYRNNRIQIRRDTIGIRS